MNPRATGRRNALVLASALLAGTGAAALADDDRPNPLPRAALDHTLLAPTVNHAPGPEYSDQARDYAMVLGIERTAGGRLWAAWIAGGDSEKGLAVAATSDDDGETWSPPVFVIDPPDLPDLPPLRVLVGNFWTDPLGRLWFFFDYSFGYFDGRAGTWAMRCDQPGADQPVWSRPERIWHGAVLNKPTVLANGDWLLPISLWDRGKIRPADQFGDNFPELDPFRRLNVFVSRDQGQSWQRLGGVQVPRPSFDEATIVQRGDGSLWLLARSADGIVESHSADGGQHWSPAELSPSIKHVAARHVLRRLDSGRLLLVKHGPRADARTTGRSHLTAFLSDDDGQTWQGGLLLDERLGVSYPDVAQAPDGMLYIAYDYQRSREREILLARVTEADILAGQLTTPHAALRRLINKARGNLPPAHD